MSTAIKERLPRVMDKKCSKCKGKCKQYAPAEVLYCPHFEKK